MMTEIHSGKGSGSLDQAMHSALRRSLRTCCQLETYGAYGPMQHNDDTYQQARLHI